tara:strand:+ start:554 stop:1195 length:642 start_codon:yes stop_codon:yes gene_type:complete
MKKNKYFDLLKNILSSGQTQQNKKGEIIYLINQSLTLDSDDLDELFKVYKVPTIKLNAELQLYMEGETREAIYQKCGINWWAYCKPKLINTYPTYFKKLGPLIRKINKELRPSKNYVLFLGETGVPTNQLPCISLIQFQICEGLLYLTIYQRSADSNLGLPCDLYQARLIAQQVNVPLGNITFFIGNAHIYKNNIEETWRLLDGCKTKFELNV